MAQHQRKAVLGGSSVDGVDRAGQAERAAAILLQRLEQAAVDLGGELFKREAIVFPNRVGLDGG